MNGLQTWVLIISSISVWTSKSLSSVRPTDGSPSPPNFNVYDPPHTSFKCEGKVTGGYYADPEAHCQLFHICVQVDENQVQDFRFLCPNDTLFDQENFVCADWRDVNCSKAVNFYSKNLDLFKPTEEEVESALGDVESALEDVASADVDVSDEDESSRQRRQLLEAPISSLEGNDNSSFSCANRSISGFFANVATNCSTFHVCHRETNGSLIQSRFQCLNGTAFDQNRLICRPRKFVSCSELPENQNLTESQLTAVKRRLELEQPVVVNLELKPTIHEIYNATNTEIETESDEDSEESNQEYNVTNTQWDYLLTNLTGHTLEVT